MSSEEHCEYEPFKSPYWQQVIVIPVFVILLFILLGHTCFHDYRSRSIPPMIRYSFLIFLILALFWFIMDFLRFVLDPHFQLLQDNVVLCGIAAYTPKVVTILFYWIYLQQLAIRLRITFKHPLIALRKCTFILLNSLIHIPIGIIVVCFFASMPPHCIWYWSPNDAPQWNASNDFAFCDLRNEGISNIIVALAMFWIFVMNIVLGIIFSYKLRNVLKNNGGNSACSFGIRAVMVKNTLLTVFASVTTLLDWFLWLLVVAPVNGGPTILYLDMLFNCFAIAGMFKYNDVYFKIVCKCCIRQCFLKFGGTKSDKQLKELKVYLSYTNLSVRAAQEMVASKTAENTSEIDVVSSEISNNATEKSVESIK